MRAPDPVHPPAFMRGSEWSHLHPHTGEVRHYVIAEIFPSRGQAAALYRLARVDVDNGLSGWATHGTLQGAVKSNPDWKPGHLGVAA